MPGFPAPALCARAGLDSIRADYILLVDGSGSMRPLWPAVQRALAGFARAVPTGDELDVRVFSGSVQNLIAPASATEASRAEWARRFDAMATPMGAHTDLGAAAEAALAAVAQAPAERQQFVFFLTDGKHDPAPGSQFPASGGGQWPTLQRKAATLAAGRPVSYAVVRLADAADRSLLAGAMSGAVVVDAIGPDALRAWFDRKAREVAVAKLQLRLTQELRGPAFEVSTEQPLRLGDGAPGVVQPLRRTVTAVLVDSAVASLPRGARIVARPGASPGTIALSSVAPDSPWYLPPVRLADTVVTVAPMHARLEPANELARIGIESAARPDSLRFRVPVAGASMARVAGYWVGVALVMLAALWLLLLLWWRTYVPHLQGRLVLHPAGDAPTSSATLQAPVKRHEVRTPDGRLLVTLVATAKRRRTTVTAIPDGMPVTLQGRRLLAPTPIRGSGRLENPDMSVEYHLSS